MKYKVVFIDWDGTLSDSRFWGGWKESIEYGAKYELLQNVLFRNKNAEQLLREWMIGQRSYGDIIGHISTSTGLDYNELVEALKHSAENMTFIDESSLDLIQQLRASGIKVVIATDNMDTFSTWTVPALRLTDIFDDILSSDALGAMKADKDPDGRSKFFDTYLTEHSLATRDAVLIDNSLANQVVTQFGMNFLHVSEAQSASDYLRALLLS